MVLRVLAFIGVRTLVNSFRRAFSNPVRAVLTTLVILFILCGWGGALLGSVLGSPSRSAPMPQGDPQTLLARALASTLIVHWFYVVSLWLSALFRPVTLLFQESDVHYLFTTPLRALSVFRGLLLMRGLLGAVMLFLMMVAYVLLMGGRTTMRAFVTLEPVIGGWALLSYPILYLLAFTGLLMVSVVLALREIQGRSARRYWVWGVLVWVGLTLMLVGWRFYGEWSAGSGFSVAMNRAADWTPAALLLFPVRCLVDSALVIYNGWTPAMLGGALFWGALVWWGNRELVRHQGWLYELGAELARLGGKVSRARKDPMRAYMERAAERAQQKPLRTLRWLERWTPQGVWALLWRDLLITWRASGWVNLLAVAVLALAPLVLMWLAARDGDATPRALQVIYLAMQSAVAFFYAFGSYYGMTEMLRRVEWQKPMPFVSWQVVVVEALPTVVFFALGQVLTILVATLWFPSMAAFWVVGSLMVTSWLVVLQMVMFMVALINPDPSDYTQRLLASFIMVPLLCLGGGPGVLVGILGLVYQWNMLLLGLAVLVVQTLLAMVLTAINATLYERFNPVD
ncbi:Putative ABC exporter [Armatimonadetes bacterium DC]|nr:Putative ABC exporter [Armatimonadetes bacterium DC]